MMNYSISPVSMGVPNGNIYQNYMNRYGVGYEDFNSRPYAQPYPMAMVPRRVEPKLQESWLGRFIRRCLMV